MKRMKKSFLEKRQKDFLVFGNHRHVIWHASGK